MYFNLTSSYSLLTYFEAPQHLVTKCDSNSAKLCHSDLIICLSFFHVMFLKLCCIFGFGCKITLTFMRILVGRHKVYLFQCRLCRCICIPVFRCADVQCTGIYIDETCMLQHTLQHTHMYVRARNWTFQHDHTLARQADIVSHYTAWSDRIFIKVYHYQCMVGKNCHPSVVQKFMHNWAPINKYFHKLKSGSLHSNLRLSCTAQKAPPLTRAHPSSPPPSLRLQVLKCSSWGHFVSVQYWYFV